MGVKGARAALLPLLSITLPVHKRPAQERRARRRKRILRGAWRRPRREHERDKPIANDLTDSSVSCSCIVTVIGRYTRDMIGVDDQAAPAPSLPLDVAAPVADPISHLAAVYRDNPGLRDLK